MKITVIGTGYVGLVGGTCFADAGNEVICVDNDQEKLSKLKSGIIPIYEPGLEALFHRSVKDGRLTFTDSLADAVKEAKVIFLALPTPPMEDGSADLTYVLSVAAEIGRIITDYKVIVNKSTVPVGTADKVYAAISSQTKIGFDVVSNPEFLREGAAVKDFMYPERVVIGTRSERARKIMDELYKPFLRTGNPIIYMDERSSELTKYAANAFLATKISFMNEVANLCERVGANVDMVRQGIGSDSRIGKLFLFAGAGYGGSCFPKDVSALFRTAGEYGYDFSILDAVMQVNNRQKHRITQKVLDFYGEDLSNRTFAIWGLAFKPNTDDIREAPALTIIEELTAHGAKINGFDPEAMESVKRYAGHLSLRLCENQYQALREADALILITEWNEFRNPDFGKVKALLREPVIFDGRNVFELEKMEELGFFYNSIGRPQVDGRNVKEQQ